MKYERILADIYVQTSEDWLEYYNLKQSNSAL